MLNPWQLGTPTLKALQSLTCFVHKTGTSWSKLAFCKRPWSSLEAVTEMDITWTAMNMSMVGDWTFCFHVEVIQDEKWNPKLRRWEPPYLLGDTNLDFKVPIYHSSCARWLDQERTSNCTWETTAFLRQNADRCCLGFPASPWPFRQWRSHPTHNRHQQVRQCLPRRPERKFQDENVNIFSLKQNKPS